MILDCAPRVLPRFQLGSTGLFALVDSLFSRAPLLVVLARSSSHLRRASVAFCISRSIVLFLSSNDWSSFCAAEPVLLPGSDQFEIDDGGCANDRALSHISTSCAQSRSFSFGCGFSLVSIEPGVESVKSCVGMSRSGFLKVFRLSQERDLLQLCTV